MKTTFLIFAIFFFNFLTFSQAGPLTGKLVINKGEITANWGDEILYEFNLKNSGDKPISIRNIITSCECQKVDKRNIQTIEPGKTGIVRVYVQVDEKQLGNQVKNGVIEYDKSVIVETNGKKPKYQLYVRATIKLKK
jgi:hypothetical protein